VATRQPTHPLYVWGSTQFVRHGELMTVPDSGKLKARGVDAAWRNLNGRRMGL